MYRECYSSAFRLRMCRGFPQCTENATHQARSVSGSHQSQWQDNNNTSQQNNECHPPPFNKVSFTRHPAPLLSSSLLSSPPLSNHLLSSPLLHTPSASVGCSPLPPLLSSPPFPSSLLPSPLLSPPPPPKDLKDPLYHSQHPRLPPRFGSVCPLVFRSFRFFGLPT